METFLLYTKNILFFGGGLFLAMAGYLYFNQNKMIYIPDVMGNGSRKISDNPAFYRSPSEHDLLFKELKIKTSDNLILYGWLVYDNDKEVKNKSTILFFHENAGNIGMRLPYISTLIKNLNINFIIVGYRGYGPSEGSPSEDGIKLDSEAILKYVFTNLEQQIDTNKIFLMGRSLGGAAAVYAQSKLNHSIRGMILENTFLSMGDLVDTLFPLFKYIKNILLKNHWETKNIIDHIKKPIFFIMADKDELVPYEHMLELVKKSTGNSVFIQKFIVKGANHNDGFIRDTKGYTENLKNFINEVLENY